LDPVPSTIYTETTITETPLPSRPRLFTSKERPKKYHYSKETIHHVKSFYPMPCREKNAKSPVPSFGNVDSHSGSVEQGLMLHTSQSTLHTLSQWIEKPPYSPVPASLLGDSCSKIPILALIQRDMAELLYHMGKELESINRHMPRDLIVQERVLYWRKVLVLFRERLQSIIQTIDSSLTILEGIEADRPSQEWSSPQLGLPRRPSFGVRTTRSSTSAPWAAWGALKSDFETLAQQTMWLGERVEQTSQSLMSTLSIIESQRAISEAESVTKLTELAFFFIPISFSATLFGMQVKVCASEENHSVSQNSNCQLQEFKNNSATIGLWLGVAILLTIISYGIRFGTRSLAMSDLKRRVLQNVRHHARLKHEGMRIPNSAFIAWPWRVFELQHSGTARWLRKAARGSSSAILAAMNSPSFQFLALIGSVLMFIFLPLLWVKSAAMDTGLKVVLTVFVCAVFVIALLLNRILSKFGPLELLSDAESDSSNGSPRQPGQRRRSSAQHSSSTEPADMNICRLLLEAACVGLIIAVGPSVLLWVLGGHLRLSIKVGCTMLFCTPIVGWFFRRLLPVLRQARASGRSSINWRKTQFFVESPSDVEATPTPSSQETTTAPMPRIISLKAVFELGFIGIIMPVVSNVLLWILGDELALGMKVGLTLIILTPTIFWMVRRWFEIRSYRGFLVYIAGGNVSDSLSGFSLETPSEEGSHANGDDVEVVHADGMQVIDIDGASVQGN
jgi:Mg2+ and Co2+ transporter CorA